MEARFDKVLVCIDGSETSMKAADYAIKIAEKHGSQLVALNVVVSELGYAQSAGGFGMVTPSTINDMLEKSKQEAQGWFDRIKQDAKARGVQFRHEVVASPTAAAPAIVDYAKDNKIDLIVIGTRGRSGLAKLLLGSAASGVVTHAGCPVMVVK
jgi:nucleotide-binding universal stress UspA family protein